MTKEEAIKYFRNAKGLSSTFDKAADLAIEALSATQTDLINRGRADAIEAIQNAYCKPCKERGDDHNEVRCRVCDYDNAIIQIDALPSADVVSHEDLLKKGETI